MYSSFSQSKVKKWLCDMLTKVRLLPYLDQWGSIGWNFWTIEIPKVQKKKKKKNQKKKKLKKKKKKTSQNKIKLIDLHFKVEHYTCLIINHN